MPDRPAAASGGKRAFPQRRSLLLLGVVLLALLPRLLFLVETFDRIEFNYLLPGLDQHLFHQSALRILEGDLLLAQESYSQGPFYSYFLAGLYRVFAPDVRVVRIVQALLGVGSCVLIYLICLRWFGLGISVACAALYSLYDYAVFMESTLLRATLVGFLYLLLLLTLARYTESRRLRWLLASGLVLGLAVATRPNSILLLPAIAWILLFSSDASAASRSPRSWAAFGAALLLPVLPFVLRNVSLGDPALHLSSQGLKVFVAGNMPDARGVGWLVSEQGQELLREAGDDWLAVVGGVLAQVLRHPGDWLLVQLQKLHALFASHEIPNNLNLYLWSQSSRVLQTCPVNVHVIASLFVCGFVLGMRSRPRRGLLYGYLAGVVLTIFPFYVIARFRLPLLGVLCVFAGFVIEEVLRGLRERRVRRLLLVALGLLVAAILTTSPVRQRIYPGSYRNLAQFYEHNGRLREAEVQYRKAFAGSPAGPRIAESLAALYLRLGEPAEAKQVAAQHLAERPGNPRMRLLLARAHAAAGEPEQAEAILVELERSNPEMSEVVQLLEALRRD
jgi:hypothetical protein